MTRLPSWRLLFIAALAAHVTACGTVNRAPDTTLGAIASPLAPAADPRLASTDIIRLPGGACARAASCPRGHAPILLALSGGGANGAYGAGVLIGWSQRGDRPSFDVVTGVSTGALSAPFAFLGDDWDDQLAQAYLGAKTRGILSWRSFAAFALPGVFSPRTLESLVNENVTPDLLRRIAEEHRRGRRLYVGTTNLDDGRQVIWDMGLIASQGDANALTLFRQVLMASASIPGVFPPVLIAGLDDDGVVRQQMHVDGAVTAGFIGVPVGTMLDPGAAADWNGARLYVIINGRINPPRQQTAGSLRAIVARSIAVTGDAALVANLQNQAIFANKTGAALWVAAIPDDVDQASLRFDRAEMGRLLELGRDLSAQGQAFSSFSKTTQEPPAGATGETGLPRSSDQTSPETDATGRVPEDVHNGSAPGNGSEVDVSDKPAARPVEAASLPVPPKAP